MAKRTAQPLHPLFELTAMRVREIMREKEAVFWVFIFPVLMTFALGIAFRNTAPDKTPVAIEATTDAKANETAQLLSGSTEITATVMSPSGGWKHSAGSMSSIPAMLQKDGRKRGQMSMALRAGPSGGSDGSSRAGQDTPAGDT